VNDTAADSVPAKNSAPATHWRPNPRGPLMIAGIVLIALAALIAILAAWGLPPFGLGIKLQHLFFLLTHRDAYSCVACR